MKFFQKLILMFAVLLTSATVSTAQTLVAPSPVQWYTMEQADSLFAIQPRPLFIDVYTEWCGWCTHMMKTTFAHAGIAGFMNNNFYNVRFDAETFDTITFQGKTYTNPGGANKPKHDLAKYLLSGRYSFPTIVYMARNKQFYPIPGYMGVPELEPFLVYFAEDLNTAVNLEDFDRYFKMSYRKNYEKKVIDAIPANMRPDSTGVVKWQSFAQAEKLSKETGKPIFVSAYTTWCQSCRVADSTNYRSKIIADMLNTNFIPVKFDAASTESVTFFGNTFKPGGQFQPHEFVKTYMKTSYQMPTLLFINSAGQQITEIHGFIPPAPMETILSFFAAKAYETQKYDDYRKIFVNKIKY